MANLKVMYFLKLIVFVYNERQTNNILNFRGLCEVLPTRSAPAAVAGLVTRHKP